MNTILITGGCGFIGTNACAYYLAKGYRVLAYDNLSRVGARENLEWLRTRTGKFIPIKGDVRDSGFVLETVKSYRPDYVLHLAAQVTMVTSLTNPREDFEINALGSFNVLEALRLTNFKGVALYASTNKVLGDLSQVPIVELPKRYSYRDVAGITEGYPLNFHGPYGCSKGCADQYFLDYARVFGLKTTVLRQSGIYGPHQFGIEEQGWLAWFINAVLFERPVTIYGDGKQVRDVLYIEDLLEAYDLALQHPGVVSGQAFNIGGGKPYSLSIWELFGLIDHICGKKPSYTFGPWRQGDQKVYISDHSLLSNSLGWHPTTAPERGVRHLYDWIDAHKDSIVKAGVFK